jgi:hypothetical protein
MADRQRSDRKVQMFNYTFPDNLVLYGNLDIAMQKVYNFTNYNVKWDILYPAGVK